MYVNYGRVEDYRWLAQNTDINITGKIVLARYGKIFRGDKVSAKTIVFDKQEEKTQLASCMQTYGITYDFR